MSEPMCSTYKSSFSSDWQVDRWREVNNSKISGSTSALIFIDLYPLTLILILGMEEDDTNVLQLPHYTHYLIVTLWDSI